MSGENDDEEDNGCGEIMAPTKSNVIIMSVAVIVL